MASDDVARLMEVLEDGDLELRFHDGRTITVHALKLKLASSPGGILRSLIVDVIEEQIAKRRRTESGGRDTASVPVLQVDGEYEDWMEVLRLMYYSDILIGPNPSELSHEKAYRIFSIAHKYNMQTILVMCNNALGKTKLELWPSEPIDSSDVPTHSGLVQWLVLADQRQSDLLVESCLSQLTASGDPSAIPIIREALASPYLRPLMDGLRSETKTKLINQLAGLSSNFQGHIPEIGRIKPATSRKGLAVGGDSYVILAGPLLIYPNNQQSAVVWDMDSNTQTGTLEWDEGDGVVYKWATTLLGSMAVSAHYTSDQVKIWNLETRQCRSTMPCPDALSPCCLESKVIVGCASGEIKVWDITPGLPAAILDMEGHSEGVHEVKASDSSSLVVSCSDDKTVRLWDLRIGGCVRVMEGHTKGVWCMDMDSGCHTAVSGSQDKTVKLWDLGSGRCTGTYEGHKDEVHYVYMHGSGGSFITQNRDGRVIAWATGVQGPFMDVELPGCNYLYANRDLSRVAVYSEHDDTAFDVKVWK